MPGQFFRRKFKNDPRDFDTITDIDEFITKTSGKTLEVKYVYPDVCSSRGSVFGIKEVGNADEYFEKALNR